MQLWELFKLKEEPKPNQTAVIHLLDGEIIKIRGNFKHIFDVYRIIDGLTYSWDLEIYDIPRNNIKYIKIEKIKEKED